MATTVNVIKKERFDDVVNLATEKVNVDVTHMKEKKAWIKNSTYIKVVYNNVVNNISR